jgi:hypothetical protein
MESLVQLLGHGMLVAGGKNIQIIRKKKNMVALVLAPLLLVEKN